jgi:hypothetical protein
LERAFAMTAPTKLTIENTTPEAYSACLEYGLGDGEYFTLKLLLSRQDTGPSPSLERIEEAMLQRVSKVLRGRLRDLDSVVTRLTDGKKDAMLGA